MEHVNVFDRSYVHRMQQYCGNVYQRYNLDPIDILASVDDTQTAREYANAGMVYTEACLYKYTQ